MITKFEILKKLKMVKLKKKNYRLFKRKNINQKDKDQMSRKKKLKGLV